MKRKASLFRDDQLVADRIEVEYLEELSITTPPGQVWHGTIHSTHAIALKCGEQLTLQMEGHTPCLIVIADLELPIRFEGLGDSPVGSDSSGIRARLEPLFDEARRLRHARAERPFEEHAELRAAHTDRLQGLLRDKASELTTSTLDADRVYLEHFGDLIRTYLDARR